MEYSRLWFATPRSMALVGSRLAQVEASSLVTFLGHTPYFTEETVVV
jgi:hypothetical protein